MTAYSRYIKRLGDAEAQEELRYHCFPLRFVGEITDYFTPKIKLIFEWTEDTIV